MNEIEKIKRYIERTKIKETGAYKMNLCEAFELAQQANAVNDPTIEIIALAFQYGKAKGYRAAKAEGSASA